jgi:hypothetical protein
MDKIDACRCTSAASVIAIFAAVRHVRRFLFVLLYVQYSVCLWFLSFSFYVLLAGQKSGWLFGMDPKDGADVWKVQVMNAQFGFCTQRLFGCLTDCSS